MMLMVPLSTKRVVIVGFATYLRERHTLVTAKFTLNAVITAELTCPSLHLPDGRPCGYITDHGRESVPHRFGANLRHIPQRYIQLRYTFVKKM